MEVDRSKPAYVVGEGNIDLTGALGLAGIKSVAMVSGKSTARFSRFVIRTLPVVDPWTEPERLVETLVRAGAEEERRPVLVYQGDGHALAVSRFRERLEPYFRFSIPPMQLTQELNDKLQFQKLAERLDLPVPAAVIISPMREGVVWCKLWDDLPVALEEGIPFWKWLRWVRTVDSVRDLAIDDPMPMIGLVLLGAQRGVTRARRLLA